MPKKTRYLLLKKINYTYMHSQDFYSTKSSIVKHDFRNYNDQDKIIFTSNNKCCCQLLETTKVYVIY